MLVESKLKKPSKMSIASCQICTNNNKVQITSELSESCCWYLTSTAFTKCCCVRTVAVYEVPLISLFQNGYTTQKSARIQLIQNWLPIHPGEVTHAVYVTPTPFCLFLVYFVANYRAHLSHFWANELVLKSCDPILVTLLKMHEKASLLQSSRSHENVTPTSGTTSPLAHYQEVP